MYWRHDLAWLSEDGWHAALADATPDDAAALAQWRDRAWPLVVTRRAQDADPDIVCLGLAMPPQADGRKRRIALRVSAQAIARHQRPLLLQDALAGAPAAWRTPLNALCEQARGVDLRVYGSLALQTVTGQAYLTDRSDIDLLLAPGNRRGLAQGMALLATHRSGLPIDGEIVFPGGAAVAWKEWMGAAPHGTRVLVKDQGAVRLAASSALLATLEP